MQKHVILSKKNSIVILSERSESKNPPVLLAGLKP